jgi:hypothetical protein
MTVWERDGPEGRRGQEGHVCRGEKGPENCGEKSRAWPDGPDAREDETPGLPGGTG